VWDTDIRVARDFRLSAVTVRGMFDVFHLLNADRRWCGTAASRRPFSRVARGRPRIARQRSDRLLTLPAVP
jgi:hypothetical protein